MTSMVTLKDVAREAGVHMSTASRALNPATRSAVNVATAGRVIEVAERLGYRPHPLARGLRTNRTMTIGMTIPDVKNPLFPPIYAGAEATLSAVGYSLMIVDDDGDREKEHWLLTAMAERRVDGLIIASAHLDFEAPEILLERQIPTVLVNRHTPGQAFPSIVGDDNSGIGLAVRHLVALGHERIAHVAGPSDLSTGLARRQAFAAWVAAEGLAADEALVVQANGFRIDSGRAACEELLGRDVPFTAIVAANDLIALGCYDALEASGRTVPGDVSVTGYNDMAFIDRVDPPLTSIAVPYQEMGAAAAEVLLDLIADGRGDGDPPQSIELQPALVVRLSTAPPSAAAPG
ncbi:MAG TPA: LacI family DNA-binding transcriptional regulator [Acidimicrobiia bacterium]